MHTNISLLESIASRVKCHWLHTEGVSFLFRLKTRHPSNRVVEILSTSTFHDLASITHKQQEIDDGDRIPKLMYTV